MATSSSRDFDLDVAEIIEEAYERCGIEIRTGYDAKTARRSLNLMFADWANRGLNLWTVTQATQSLTSGTASYSFSTNFTDITPEAEFFDVYTPSITSKYADVYWTMMPEIPLSKEIVSRFNNKVMAITGYEMDQVIVHPNGMEESIPCFWSYNHHYVAHLQGANSKMIKLKTPSNNEMWDFSHGPEAYKFITINFRPRQFFA